MDIRSTRAHACQILNTVVSMGSGLSMYIVLPKYHREIDFDIAKKNHGLLYMPKLVFLRNFGIRKSGIVAYTLFSVPATLFLLQKKIGKEIDFLYFRSGYFVPLAILARILRIPFFYETHRRPITWSERCRDYIMSKLSTGIIVISNYMKGHYLPYRKELLVAHDAVSLKRFAGRIGRMESRRKLALPPNQNVCVYAGTVSKLKGIEYVISAARILPEVLIILVGVVSPELSNQNFPSNIKLLGRVEQGELPYILQAADVLLLPHPNSEYSQSPMKLFEYMASDVPIVASRLPSICEILNDNNSILVEPENPSALAAGIRKALENEKHSRQLATQALADVQNYTWEARGKKIAGFITKTVHIYE